MAKNDGLRTWFREIPLESGVSEFFFTASYTRQASGEIEDVLRDALRKIPKISEFVSVTVFHPSEEPLSESAVSSFRELAPTSFVGGRGRGYFSFVLTGYSFENETVRDAAFRKKNLERAGTSKLVLPSFTKTTLDAFAADGPFDAQIDRFYDSVTKVMDENGLRPEDFVRSWNYVDSILKVYPVFNAVRDRRFDEMGISRAKCPAGTGIDCVLNGSGMAAFAEFHSAGTASSPKVVTYKAGPQCEALDYGPRFSRAAYVEAAGWRRIHISGTASVGPNGETLNSDDIVANVAHTMETVRELLDIAGADFSHVVRSHAYFKKQEFIPEFDLWQGRTGIDFPVARNVCDVCRADWLFEFECVAFVPIKRTPFRTFGEEGGCVGNKADNCRILARSGFPVPRSLALTGQAARAAVESGEMGCALSLAFAGAFSEDCHALRYAVRSSSRFEDSGAVSKAGAFRSVIDVPFENLISAISEVVRSYGENVSTDDFGVLVQEYVPLETFGVAFTCDPEMRSHATVCEVSRGPGEALVSGSNVPVKVEFSRNAEIGWSFEAEGFSVDWEFWRKTFRRIESVFRVPQDVEWGMAKNGVPFVFQSRPITTLKTGELALLKALDRFEVENLPKEAKRRLVRNELCEPFDSPTEEEFAFLARLYAHDAVVSAYARWGITYRPVPFLVRIGEKLFIDADREGACFDSYSGGGLFSAFGRLKNFWNLGAVGAKVSSNPKEVLGTLETKLLAVLNEALEFLSNAHDRAEISEDRVLSEWYSPVFETNFAASSWEAGFVRFGKKVPTTGRPYVPEDASRWKAVSARLASAGLSGNSLAFSDGSVFDTPFFDEGRFEGGFESARNSGIAERLDFLREAGRCVSVIVSNLLRPASVSDRSDRMRVNVPHAISVPSVPSVRASTSWDAVSDGNAEGEFFPWSQGGHVPEGASVAFVPFLDPALANELPASVVAVVSLSGGRLSHFAIVARERKLPVFVSPGLRSEEYFGKRVRVLPEGISPA